MPALSKPPRRGVELSTPSVILPPVADTPPPASYHRTNLDPVKLEELTRRCGQKLSAITRRCEPAPWKAAGLEKIMMSTLMKDEELKYRMLRFVDVYPALHRDDAVAAHLQEYLESPHLSFGKPTTGLANLTRFVTRARGFTEAPISWATKTGIRVMGKQFIAGDTPETVAPRIRGMEAEGFLFTLDLLGEFVASESQAEEFAGRYRDMLERFGKILGPMPAGAKRAASACGPRVNVSIKLSSLTSKFDPMDAEGTCEAVLGRLRPLLRAARKSGAYIHIDMEKYEYRDLTLEIIQRLLEEDEFRGFPHIGTVIQSYLKDSEESLDKFLAWIRRANQPMTLRLVKGAYWDSEQIWARSKGWRNPVITNKRETDAQYERMTRQLMENSDIVRTAVASHNMRSIAHAMALMQALNVKPPQVEFQVLFGMAGPIKDAMLRMGLPVRVYTPCGQLIPGMAYLVRRILENTSNDSFLRQRFSDGVAEDKLMADPKAGSDLLRARRTRS